MAEYIPLARRLRPRRFADVVGQDHVTRTLRNQIRERKLPQTFLFEGDRGLGKTTLGRLLAARVNCDNAESNDPEPCGECASCRAILGGTETMLVREVNCGLFNKTEDMQNLVAQSEWSSGNKKRIFILDEFHHVSPAGRTNLLKVTEEPNPNVMWIFCTTEGHKLPQTNRSRMTAFRLRPLSDAAMIAWLRGVLEDLMESDDAQLTGYDDDALEEIARSADGSPRQALTDLEAIIAYGADRLTRSVVRTVTGRIGHDEINNFIDTVVAGNLDQASRLLRDLYTDQFTSDLLSALFSVYLPRSGSLKSAERRRVAALIRATMQFQSTSTSYSHAVNRDGLLFVLHDAVVSLGKSSANPATEREPVAPAKVMTKEEKRAALVSELIGRIQDGGVVEVAHEWDGTIMVVELGKKRVPLAISRDAEAVPDGVGLVLPYNQIREVLKRDGFKPKALINAGLILEWTE